MDAIPVIQHPQSTLSGYSEGFVYLYCVISANPPVTTVFWNKISGSNTETISTNFGKYRIYYDHVPIVQLTIHSLDETDAGMYVCGATNAAGSSTYQTNGTMLTIEAIPVVQDYHLNVTVYEGNSIFFDYTVSANPPATSLVCTKTSGSNTSIVSIGTLGDKYIVRGANTPLPYLTIYSLDMSDAGTYKCKARNNIGSGQSNGIALTIRQRVTFTFPKSTYSAVPGGSVTLEFSVVPSNELISFTWFRRNYGIGFYSFKLRNGSKYSYSVDSTPSLTISSLSTNDTGMYYVSITTASGGPLYYTNSTREIYLTVAFVNAAPVVHTPKTALSAMVSSNYATLVYIVSANPLAYSVVWKKTSGSNTDNITIDWDKYWNGDASVPSLRINDLSVTDTGIYVCEATNAFGSGQSTGVTLTVIDDRPNVTVGSASYYTTVGTNITLQCTVTSSRSITNVFWQRGINGVISVLTIDNVKYSGGSLALPSLTIISTQTSDSGAYTCFGSNFNGRQSAITQLTLISGVPTVTISQAAYTVIAGQTVTLGCKVSASPPHTSVYWQRIDSGVTTALNIDEIKYSGSTVTSPSLTITSAGSNDASDYTCSATNVVGTGTSGRTTLTVTDIPVVTVDQAQYSVITGQTITLGCTVKASPGHTSVLWQKRLHGTTVNVNIDGNKYQGSSVVNPDLTVTNTAVSDQASYTCSATNVVGTGTSTPTILTVTGNVPFVTISQAAYTVIAGQTVTLGCTVSASPPHTSVYWQRIESGVATTLNIERNKYFGSTVTSPSLTITSAGSNDTSDYICLATNVVGTGTSGQTALTVTDIPVVTVDQAQYSVITGQAITLGCTVKASPGHTSVFWQKRLHGTTMNVNIDGNKYQGNSVVNPDLTVTNTAVSDQASYTCSATNIIGTGTSTPTILTVTGSVPIVTISQAAYTIIAGQTVTLGCTVSASPPHTSVYWQRIHSGVPTTLNIDGIKYSGSTVTSPSLTITSAGSNDASDYTCSATNAVGTGTSGQTTLTVTDIPVVTVDQAHYYVITGQTITLGCTVTASPDHTSVFWQKRLHGTTMNVNIDGNKYQGSSVVNPDLTVTNTAVSDQASYTCSATNIIGTGTSTPTILTVTGSVPSVTMAQAAYTVIAGQTVTLGCTVSASPPHTSVYWQRIDSGLTTTLNIDGIKYSGSTVTSPSLTITSAGSHDASDYTCSATNVVGTGTSGQTTLTVTDIPVVTVDQAQYSVITGQTITLGCTVTASPGHTSVFWQKRLHGTTMNVNIDGNKYQGSSVVNPDLTVTNTAVSDQASYACSATNIIGTGTSTPTILTVTGSVPFVTISQAAYTVITGQTVILGCTVSASPPHTSVYWQRIDSGVTTTLNIDGIKYSGSTVISPSLTITSAGSNDASDYTCSATNAVGTGTSGQTTLTVTGGIPAVLVPQTTYEVTTGAVVTLVCNVNANPTAQSVLWEKLHEILFIQVVITTNNRYAGGTVNVPSLTITDSQPPDSGTYRCSATNSVGTGTSGTLQLTVTGGIPTVSVPETHYTAVSGGTLILVCNIISNPIHTSVIWQKLVNHIYHQVEIATSSRHSGGTISSPSLQITNVQSDDSGTYRCSAANQVGTGVSSSIELQVSGSVLSVAIPQSTYSTTSGWPMTLVCIVESSQTETDVTWEKFVNDSYHNVQIASNKRYSGGTRHVPSLFISSALTSDSGSYRCKAENLFGAAVSGSTQLTVYGIVPRVSIIQTAYSTTTGGSVTLVCDVSADPFQTSVTWEKLVGNLYQPVSIGVNDRYSGGTPELPPLVITDSDTSDSGTYRCTVTNPVGTSSSETTQLTVNENETIELVDNNSVTLAIGISAALIMVLMIALIVLCACKWRVRKQNELVGLSDGTTSSTPPEGTGLSKTNNKSRVRGNDNSNSSAPTGSNSISSRSSTDYCRIDSISSVMLDHRAAHNRPRRDLTPFTYANATFDTGVSDPQAYLTVINSTLSSTTRKQSSPFHRNTDTYSWKSSSSTLR